MHEFAHALDAASTYPNILNGCTPADDATECMWSASDAWQRAIADSPCAVSVYAQTNDLEDFAESVEAWFAYYQGRGRLDSQTRSALRERLGKRFGLLNRLMHGRFDD